jgi:hypothetical protein
MKGNLRKRARINCPKSRNASAKAAANPWGIPDWLNPAEYGDTAEWSNDRWRWEFTRRRDDYRKAFDASADKTYALRIELYKTLEVGGRIIRPDEIRKPNDPFFVAQATALREFGLSALPNPRFSKQPSTNISFQGEPTRFYIGEGAEWPQATGEPAAEEIPVPKGWLAVVFDLSRPLERQLQGVKGWFDFWQIEQFGKVIPTGRLHRKKWLTYLRVLDGRAAGASWSELTVVLGKHMRSNVRREPQAAAQVYRAARALMFNWPI